MEYEIEFGSEQFPIRIWRPSTADLNLTVDSESSVGSVIAESEEDSTSLSLSAHLERHKNNIAEQCQQWQLQNMEPSPRRMVINPTASRLTSLVLHPSLYRDTVPMSVDQFAQFSNVPDNWRDLISPIMTHQMVRWLLRNTF